MNYLKKLIIILTASGLIFAPFVLAKMEIIPKEGEKMMRGMGIKKEEIAPEAEFLFPKEGEKIKEVVEIKPRVKNALSIEFYLQRPGEPIPIYLGKASLLKEDLWQYSFDTKNFPNGSYKLFAQITNQYGQYQSKEIPVLIENEVKKADTEEIERGIEKAREEINQKEKEIAKEKNKTIEEIKPQIKEGEEGLINESVDRLVKKTQEMAALNKAIRKIEQENKETERRIEEIKKAVVTLPEKPIETLKIDKELQLEGYQKKREKEKEEIKLSQRSFEEIKKDKEEIKKEIIEKTEEGKKEAVREEIEKLEKIVSEKEKEKAEKMEILVKDSDLDGLSDDEELRLETNPLNPDSDGDGFLDEVEILTGYDPLKPGPADKIIYQDPRKVPPKKTEIYQVEKIEKIILPNGEIGFKLFGKGLPNSFVTLYLFSLPTVMVVKTDNNGHWEYILDKPLTDGEHTVYAAITNNQGKIEARSEGFVFRKLGNQVFRIFQSPETEAALPPAKILQRSFIILTIGIILFGLGLALVLIGLLVRKKEKI